MVNYLMGRYTVGMRQACRCVQMTRSMYYYRSRMDPQTALRQCMREIAHARVRFGSSSFPLIRMTATPETASKAQRLPLRGPSGPLLLLG